MINNKRILAVIPARYGSRRLKHKNLLKINNKSLIELAFNSAKKSKYIDRTVVSTENKIIKKSCEKFDKDAVISRPKSLSQDNTKSEKVLIDVIKKIGKDFYYIILLQPTSPLRTTQDIDKALRKIDKNKFDNLVSICVTSQINSYYISSTRNLLIKKKKINVKKKKFKVNGAIYICKKKNFLKEKTFFSKKTGFIKMPKLRSIDIDYKEDFIEAKKLIENDFKGRKNYN